MFKLLDFTKKLFWFIIPHLKIGHRWFNWEIMDWFLPALKFFCLSLSSSGKLSQRCLYRSFNCTFVFLSLQKRKDARHRREELLQLFLFKNKEKSLFKLWGTIHSLLLLEIQEVVKQLNFQNTYMKQVILFWDNTGSIFKIYPWRLWTCILYKCPPFVL